MGNNRYAGSLIISFSLNNLTKASTGLCHNLSEFQHLARSIQHLKEKVVGVFHVLWYLSAVLRNVSVFTLSL